MSARYVLPSRLLMIHFGADTLYESQGWVPNPKRPLRLQENSLSQVYNALKLLYADLYKRPFVIQDLPRPRKERKLPDILSESEVVSIFDSVTNLKHKTILMLAYASGLRVSEVVRLFDKRLCASRTASNIGKHGNTCVCEHFANNARVRTHCVLPAPRYAPRNPSKQHL